MYANWRRTRLCVSDDSVMRDVTIEMHDLRVSVLRAGTSRMMRFHVVVACQCRGSSQSWCYSWSDSPALSWSTYRQRHDQPRLSPNLLPAASSLTCQHQIRPRWHGPAVVGTQRTQRRHECPSEITMWEKLIRDSPTQRTEMRRSRISIIISCITKSSEMRARVHFRLVYIGDVLS
jgi:hypothetical protein